MGKAINELDNAGSITDATLVPVGETNTLKKTTWANIKATLKTYFDSLYLAVTGGTITDATSAGSGSLAGSALTVNQTWNTTGTPTAVKLNVTDTASNANSLLMDLQVGGVSKLNVKKQYGAIELTDANGSLLVLQSAGNVGAQYGAYGVRFRSSATVEWSSVSGAINGPNDLYLHRDAAGTLAQRNGTNAQTFRLYNTYTDSSNYERGFVRWNSNVLEIGTEALGTGTGRAMKLMQGGNAAGLIDTSSRVIIGSAEFDDGYVSLFESRAEAQSRTIASRSILINTADTASILVRAAGKFGFTAAANNADVGVSADTAIARNAAGVLEINTGTVGAGAALQFNEQTAPAAPATNGVRIYAEDNGAGKTRLMALFATGAAVQIAIEP